jgi:menaquinone-specific isochorismate synthase
MVIDQNKIISDFSDFLSENKNILGKQDFANYLISYKFPKASPELQNNLTTVLRQYPRTFYFENLNSKFSLIGLGTALEISENGLARFSSLSKTHKELKRKIISNWNVEVEKIPLIYGGMKFTAEHSEEEWVDFKDSDWFIPEFMQVNQSDSKHLIYNFINQGTSIKKQIDKFSKRLEDILQTKSDGQNKIASVLSSKGLSPKDKKKWKILISDTMDRMSEQNIMKAVVSRRVDLVLSEELNWDDVRKYFSDNYSDCYIFIYHKNNSTFFGASPERLMKIHDKQITIDILAGSISRGKTDDEDKKLELELLNSSKLKNEHDLVIHQIKKAITKYVSKFHLYKVPYKKLLNIQHLHTILQTELLADTNLFDVIEAIYPTGAICGEPKEKALSLLKKIEDHKRGLYSGIIGYFNLNDEGEFVIGIRSALLHEKKLFAYAGCGILEGSDPDKEFEETELKLNAILSFFNAKN